MANDPRLGARSSPTNSPIGTISTSISTASRIRSSGHGFIGIGRKRLLEILQDRARELGVALHFEHECEPADLDDWARLRPRHRRRRRQQPHPRRATPDAFRRRRRRARQQVRLARHVARCSTPSPSPSRRPSTAGSGRTPIASRPTARPSSSNGRETTWRGLGFDRMDQAEAIAACEQIFAKYLDGHPLMSNAAHLRGSAAWLNFRRIICERWSHGNLILLGDAAHTAHFSIGSGTKLALEDAIKLAEVLNRPGLGARSGARRISAPSATSRCSSCRTAPATRPNGSRRSTAISHFEPLQFAYSLLTRSRSASATRICACATSDWLEGVERWFWRARRRAGQDRRRRCSRRSSCASMTLDNRIVVSPMAMYSAVDGTPERLPPRPLRRRARWAAPGWSSPR